VPRARETGKLKNVPICDTDEKIPSTKTQALADYVILHKIKN